MIVNAARKIIRETEGFDVDLLCAKTRTCIRVKAARKTIKETECLPVPLLREHPSLSLASHTQVANVIAKCLPCSLWNRFSFGLNLVDHPLSKDKIAETKTKEAYNGICSNGHNGICTST
jgi:hypothetical protein